MVIIIIHITICSIFGTEKPLLPDRTHAPQTDTATPKHPVPTWSRTKQRLAPIYVFGFNPEFYAKVALLLQNFTLAH